MTIIAALSNISSVSSVNSLSSKQMNFKSSSASSSTFGNNQNAHLADVNILANILGLIGLNVSAKVL